MDVVGTCGTFSADECKRLMRGARRVSYKKMVAKIKKELPELYEELALQYSNPFEDQCSQTKTHYILVHSAIDYFILK